MHTCMYCGQRYDSERELEDHVLAAHRSDDLPADEEVGFQVLDQSIAEDGTVIFHKIRMLPDRRAERKPWTKTSTQSSAGHEGGGDTTC